MTSPLRYLRQVVAPNGRHRARPVLLPDEPIPAAAIGTRDHLTEDQLHQQLESGEAAVTESAPCPRCKCTRAHAMGRWTRQCWTCETTSLLEAS